ncbi:hypothetical protein V1503_18715 [Bacillus sp. SCS-151]|uniref:hypothetical protein n=1 Tax=Nanhaiella sioensis TaxID=3115293 RepID=UPI0039789CAF
MKKVVMSCFILMLLFSGVSFANGNNFTDSQNTIAMESTNAPIQVASYEPGVCIGGTECGGNSEYHQENLWGKKYIKQIIVYAHDRVGSTSTANLELYIDGELVDSQAVFEEGSFLIYNVEREGSYIRFYSVHENGLKQGDETFIATIDAYVTEETVEEEVLLAMYKKEVCIGGSECGGNSAYYEENLWGQKNIRNIVVYAHDKVGDTFTSKLELYIDGVLIDTQGVKNNGSLITFEVNQVGELVQLYSISNSVDLPEGDETVIKTMDVYYTETGTD